MVKAEKSQAATGFGRLILPNAALKHFAIPAPSKEKVEELAKKCKRETIAVWLFSAIPLYISP
ncbi:MAG: hypothetical protein IKE65_04140 [Clostridia bacterium]|nr:hypothetical protein [Clostridia bacterium]